MSKVEQLRNRLMKLRDRFLEEEVVETIGSTRSLVLKGGKITEDYPLIMCPVCQEEAQAVEGQLDQEHNSWLYFDTTCSTCHTSFRIGEVQERCCLCRNPLSSDPYYDANELNHHWCKKNGQIYCTPCFMQLFFDGYIDLSSDECPIMADCRQCTHVGYTIDPYHSRLISIGYEEFAIVQTCDDVRQTCQYIMDEGGRYLILYTSSEESPQREYTIYRKR